jgi:hypothetical protein
MTPLAMAFELASIPSPPFHRFRQWSSQRRAVSFDSSTLLPPFPSGFPLVDVIAAVSAIAALSYRRIYSQSSFCPHRCHIWSMPFLPFDHLERGLIGKNSGLFCLSRED